MNNIELLTVVKNANGMDLTNKNVLGVNGNAHALCVGSSEYAGRLINRILSDSLHKVTEGELEIKLLDSAGTIGTQNCSQSVEYIGTQSAYGVIREYKRLEEEVARRYEVLKHAGCKNIDEYNAMQKEKGYQTMSKILLMHSEADILSHDEKHFNEMLFDMKYILKLGRATGVHLFLATTVSPCRVFGKDVVDSLTLRYVFTTDAVTSLELLGKEHAITLRLNQFYVRSLSNPWVKEDSYFQL